MPIMKVNNVAIHYEVHGKGETIALLNGIMQNTAGWVNQTHEFAKEYQVLLHDMRGQGQSDKPQEEYTWDVHVEDFKALLDQLGIERVDVVGVSYGAEVALHFALKYPEYVRRMVIGTATSELTPLMRAFAESWEVAAGLRDGKKFFKLFSPSIYGNTYYRNNWEWLEQRTEIFARVVTDEWFAGFERLLKNFYTLDITNRLKDIHSQTLVIAGEKDLLKPVEMSNLIKDNIPGAELIVIADCGHVAIFEKPVEFNAAVLRFLGKE